MFALLFLFMSFNIIYLYVCITMIKYTCVCMSMFKGDVLLSMENLQEQKKKKSY